MAALAVEGRPIRVEAPGAPVWVRADRLRLGQVLGNLLTNALRYSPAESEVAVRVWAEANRAQVAVADQGVGIAAERLPGWYSNPRG